MTLTATSATTSAVERFAFGDLDAADTIVTSVESRRVGALYVGLTLLAVIALAGAGAVLHLHLAEGDLLDNDAAIRLGLTFESLLAYLALPVWFAVATVVVPHQIGAVSAALPRVQAFAPWGFVAGIGLVLAGTFAGDGPATVRVFDRVANGSAWGQFKADDLLLAGLIAIVVSSIAAAANVFATVLTQRRPGLGLADINPFSWSMLVTSAITLVSYGVAVGGLLVVYLDAHYGGTAFDQPSAARVWGSMVWSLGRPDSLLALIPAAGFVTSLFAAKGSLAGGAPGRWLLSAAGASTLLVWTSGTRLLSETDAPVAPFSRSGALLIVPILGLLSLVWVASLRSGLRPSVGLVGALGLLALGGLGVVFGLWVTLGDLGNFEQAPRLFQQGFAYLIFLGIPVTVAVAAVQESARAWGRTANPVLTGLSTLVALAGAALMAAGPLIGGLLDKAEPGTDRLAALGAGVLGAGVALALINLFISNVAGKGRLAPSDAAALAGGTD